MASKTVSRLRSSLRRLNMGATPFRAWRPTLWGHNYCGKPCWVPTRIGQGVSLAEPLSVLPLEDHRHIVVQFRHLGVRRGGQDGEAARHRLVGPTEALP